MELKYSMADSAEVDSKNFQLIFQAVENFLPTNSISGQLGVRKLDAAESRMDCAQ
jgi:hypothetical protein